jgi:hypothetical protein
MKIKFTIAFLLISAFNAYSQNVLDKSLNEISIDIAKKLSQKGKKKIVVLYVTDINKSQTVAGKYMADVISVNIVNDQGNFEVFDRENLSGIVEAKKMIAEGYIDANKAKELGKLLAVDAIVIGNYTVLTKTLKLTLKALDVNSGFVIGATMKDLPITEDAGALLGISVGTVDNNVNKGFNDRPLNSNESYNNPETVNSKCKEQNTGDYCFKNDTKLELEVYLNDLRKDCTLQPGQTQCFYDIRVGSIGYIITESNSYKYKGEINIEQCKSKTFVIK